MQVVKLDETAASAANLLPEDSKDRLCLGAARWCLTLNQFYAFLEHCMADPLWSVIKAANQEGDLTYSAFKQNLNRSVSAAKQLRDQQAEEPYADGLKWEPASSGEPPKGFVEIENKDLAKVRVHVLLPPPLPLLTHLGVV